MGSYINLRRVAGALVLVWLGTLLYLWCVRWSKKPKDGLLLEKGLELGGGRAFALRFEKRTAVNMSAPDLVHVVMASDGNTLGGMITTIHSLYRNTKHPVYFHLITDRNSSHHLRLWIESSPLHDISYEVKNFPQEWVEGKILVRGGRQELASPLNYARFYLPRLFPDLRGRIVYIDDDTLVQGDIYELYTMSFRPGHIAAFSEDCHLAAKRVTMMQNTFIDYIDFKNEHVRQLNISPKACAFNTGVFVTDLSLWGKLNITSQLEFWMELNTREEVYGNEKGGGGSQPPMMLVFHGKFTPMDPMWHVRYLGWTRGTSYSSSYISKAKLLHWNGLFKPWGRVAQHSKFWDKYFIKDPLMKFIPVRRTN